MMPRYEVARYVTIDAEDEDAALADVIAQAGDVDATWSVTEAAPLEESAS